MGEPCPKKNAGILSGVEGSASSAVRHSGCVLGNGDAVLLVGVDIVWKANDGKKRFSGSLNRMTAEAMESARRKRYVLRGIEHAEVGTVPKHYSLLHKCLVDAVEDDEETVLSVQYSFLMW